MKTIEQSKQYVHMNCQSRINLLGSKSLITTDLFRQIQVFILMLVSLANLDCTKNADDVIVNPATTTGDKYTIAQTISDEAQRNTISFDGLAFLTGSVGSQSFLPPGKVADYSGFQYLRDNDPTNLGHNTSFVTIIANNILNILTSEQINLFVERAKNQISLINDFAYKRFPLLKAFQRLKESDLPAGTTELSKDEVINYTGELYKLDGQISFGRAQIFGEVINSLSSEQKGKLDALKGLKGIGNWSNNLPNQLDGLNLEQDVNVAVMTYASEMYAWYAGTVTSDVYFCPERQGTYFGSFYLKDWPAMGNPNYTINEQLTASAGENFLSILTSTQASKVRGIVDLQRNALLELVAKREAISTELRKFLSSDSADSLSIITLSERYGELDGEISYYYATTFTEVYNSLSSEQKEKVLSLVSELGFVQPSGAFLYSQPIAMPEIASTDFMFK
jgi:hypothetical protein